MVALSGFALGASAIATPFDAVILAAAAASTTAAPAATSPAGTFSVRAAFIAALADGPLVTFVVGHVVNAPGPHRVFTVLAARWAAVAWRLVGMATLGCGRRPRGRRSRFDGGPASRRTRSRRFAAALNAQLGRQ